MKKTSDKKATLARALILFLQILALAMHIVAIPEISASLSRTYTEYANDRLFIQIMLSGIVATGQLVLAIIWYLLRRVGTQRLLVRSSSPWVSTLSASSFVLAGLFGLLMIWLINKNTLPPFVSIALLFAILMSTIVGLISASLKGVLKNATEARLDLEGVI